MINEHGYFRSQGRGGENQKFACPFFSIGRMTMKQSALERIMSQDNQKIVCMHIGSLEKFLRDSQSES